MSVQAASIRWVQDASGKEIPYSTSFNDIYFSPENGLKETWHVFIEGNDLPERLGKLSAGQTFTVAETGFGTGLNLLALWQLWNKICTQKPHGWLHFISFEKFPLTATDLQRALHAWPELQTQATALLEQYPPLLAGIHRLRFPDHRLSVDLWWGDITDTLPQVRWGTQVRQPVNPDDLAKCQGMTYTGGVNAWFLDGFAPACNEQMWANSVFSHIRRLSHAGTTLSSFSVAGVVKRALRSQGAVLHKAPGFGRKREMLRARFQSAAPVLSGRFQPLATSADTAGSILSGIKSVPFKPEPGTAPTLPLPRTAVIGAGVAGLSVAYSLALRGFPVDLYDQEEELAGASGNPVALLSFKPPPPDRVAGSLAVSGCLSTLRWWGNTGIARTTGIIHLETGRKKNSLSCFRPYPAGLVMPDPPESTTTTRHLISGAGILVPRLMAVHILAHPNIQRVRARVAQLDKRPGGWQLITARNDAPVFYPHVVICNALACNQLYSQLPALNPVRGQVSWLNPEQWSANNNFMPARPLSYGGYLIPPGLVCDGKSPFIFGASFIRQSTDTAVTSADHQHNLGLLAAMQPELAGSLPPDTQWQGRAAIRAQSRDYMPLAGQLDEGLYVLAGLGSKGFSFAPLCGEVIAALVTGTAIPMTPDMLQQVDPLRKTLHSPATRPAETISSTP